jgi:hypothetical protein
MSTYSVQYLVTPYVVNLPMKLVEGATFTWQKLSAHLLYVMSVEMRGFNKDVVPDTEVPRLRCHHTVCTPKDSHTRAVPSLLISTQSSLSYPVSGLTWEAFFSRHSGLLLPLLSLHYGIVSRPSRGLRASNLFRPAR